MADQLPPPTPAQPTLRRGLVKQVLSGDAIVIQGQATNGPPPEATVYLSNVVAPRLGRRPTDNAPGTPDEPFAWEAREFLRKKVVGQMATFIKDFTATSGRDHGRIYLGGTSPENAENVAESAVEAGWLEVRPGKVSDEYTTKLSDLQEHAKAGNKGRWSSTPNAVREVTWVIENPRELVDKYNQKPVDAVVEMVRDGSTIRIFLLPSFEYITVQLSGLRCPSVGQGRAEPYSEEAKFFVEQRLLQQDIQVILEGVSNQNFVGSVLHPKGNIAEALLREGFAKCVDWSIGLCTGGPEKLRAAEKQAKDKRIRLWQSYQAPTAGLSADKRSFQAKVVETVMSDALMVQKEDGTVSKIFLSSIRLPRDSDDKPAVGRQFRPLYDIPFMFQAREFLRKRLIGKKVQVTVDYIQPKSESFPEKTCCTVKIGDTNIAEALIQKGLSKVVRYRADDENRSGEYDTLLAAEANAEKNKKGLFADKSADKKDTLRIQELQGDLARSKQFLPYLTKGGARVEGVVEFISSGSRLRIYIPKETVIITFLLGGINCPKSARPNPQGGAAGIDEPFCHEAADFTRKLVLQREVEIEVEGLDKMGNFIGYLFVAQEGGGRPQNLSELLLEQGLASLHFTAEKSANYNSLVSAENRARTARRNIWANYKEEAPVEDAVEVQPDTGDRKVNYKKIAVTDIVKGSLKFYAQFVDDGAKLEKITSELREQLKSNPPMTGSYHPKKGEMCVAPFSVDGQWYRARVEAVKGGKADVFYIDYGNRESLDLNKLAQIPAGYTSFPAAAREFALALTAIPNDKDYGEQCESTFANMLFSSPTAEVNSEYRNGTTDCVQVMIESNGGKIDVGKTLIAEGFALVEKRREARLQTMLNEYTEAEKKARRERLNIWEFGDFTGSDL